TEDECEFVAVGPSQSFGYKTQRGLIRSRPHDVAVDPFKKGLHESRVQGLSAREFVCGFEPVDAPVLSSNEAVEARRHVNRYARISVCHHIALYPSVVARNDAWRCRWPNENRADWESARWTGEPERANELGRS